MDEIKNWALMLLFMSGAGFIYYCIMPSGKLNKTAKSIFSVLVLLAVTVPLYNVLSNGGELDAVFNGNNLPDTSYSAETLINSGKRVIERQLDAVIREYTDISYKSDIGININEDYSINIEYVNIEFAAKPENKREIAFAVEERLGLHPQITEAGDE